jgi:hypothetical protein
MIKEERGTMNGIGSVGQIALLQIDSIRPDQTQPMVLTRFPFSLVSGLLFIVHHSSFIVSSLDCDG